MCAVKPCENFDKPYKTKDIVCEIIFCKITLGLTQLFQKFDSEICIYTFYNKTLYQIPIHSIGEIWKL